MREHLPRMKKQSVYTHLNEDTTQVEAHQYARTDERTQKPHPPWSRHTKRHANERKEMHPHTKTPTKTRNEELTHIEKITQPKMKDSSKSFIFVRVEKLLF